MAGEQNGAGIGDDISEGGVSIREMANQRVEMRAGFGGVNRGDGVRVGGVRTQPIDGFGGEGDEFARAEQGAGAGDAVSIVGQIEGGDARIGHRRLRVKIEADLRGVEQFIDPGRFIERGVGLEMQIRDHPQAQAAPDFTAQKWARALEGGQKRRDVAAAEEGGENSGVFQVRADPHFGHGDFHAQQSRVTEIGATQHIGKPVANLLRHPPLALARLARRYAGTISVS